MKLRPLTNISSARVTIPAVRGFSINSGETRKFDETTLSHPAVRPFIPNVLREGEPAEVEVTVPMVEPKAPVELPVIVPEVPEIQGEPEATEPVLEPIVPVDEPTEDKTEKSPEDLKSVLKSLQVNDTIAAKVMKEFADFAALAGATEKQLTTLGMSKVAVKKLMEYGK